MISEWPEFDIKLPYIIWRDQEYIGIVNMKKKVAYKLFKSEFSPFEYNGKEN